MHQCDVCGARYTSLFAAAECGEQDRVDDLHARQMIRGRHRATQ